MEDEDSPSEILAISEANNHLALNLYQHMTKEDNNVFFSPFSISTALAMLYCGSAQKTAQEMRVALGYEKAGIKGDNLKSSFKQILEEVENSRDSYTLDCANAIFIQDEFPFKEEFKTLLNEHFKAMIQEVDFKNDSENAVKQVNDWVNEKTNKMIPQLLDSLDPSTLMAVLNAVYFKGSWLEKFNEDETTRQPFYNNGDEGNSKEVDMMYLEKEFEYIGKDSYKALILPYRGEEISMLILLPNTKNGLEDLEQTLGPNFIQECTQAMNETELKVLLPKFHLEYSKSLVGALQSLGTNLIFQDGAEFDGISDSGKLFVSEIFHKAVVEVNEEGSEAAAATVGVVALSAKSPQPEFIVDHPFMFVIYNTENSLILFMGRVDEL